MSSRGKHILSRSFVRAIKALIVISVLFVAGGQSAVGPQNDLSAQVSRAVALIPNEPKLARRRLVALGPSAFPFLLRIVREDAGLGVIRRTFLIDVIARSKTKQSASALIELLTDPDPYVRGLAAAYLGKRRYKPAIPYLVKLLNDKDVFVTNIKTDPERKEPVLVRDQVVQALEAITRRRANGRTQDERVKDWLRWWEEQRHRTK